MVRGEKVYYDIQEAGRKSVEEISERILSELYPTFCLICFIRKWILSLDGMCIK